MTATSPSVALRHDVLNRIPGFVWVHDPEADATVWISAYWYTYSGQERSETVGETVAAIIHPDDLGPMLEMWGRNRDRGTAYTALARYRNTRGEYRWHRYSVRPEGGFWYGVAVDIHAEAKALVQRVSAAEALALGRMATKAVSDTAAQHRRLARTIWLAVAVVLLGLACAAAWATHRLGGL